MLQAISRHIGDTKCIVALGSNVLSPAGPPLATVPAAVVALSDAGLRVTAASRLYETPCFPAGTGKPYVNAAISLETDLSATALLALLHAVEQKFERRREVRWGSRTLDLDLVDHGGGISPNRRVWDAWYHMPGEAQVIRSPEELILPHPRIQDRGFVLVPLADIAADWVHPVLNRTPLQMLDALPPDALDGIKPLDEGETLALCVAGG